MTTSPRPLRFGILCGLVGFGASAVAALALQLLIARYGGTEVLGTFNLVFAAYIVFSQFATWGVHLSVAQAAALQHDEPQEASASLLAGLKLVLPSSVIAAIVMALGAKLAVVVFDSPEVEVGFLWAAAAIPLFAINKVLLASLNGLRRMGAFAFLQAGRAVILTVCGGVLLWQGHHWSLAAAFLVCELLVLPATLICLWKAGLRPRDTRSHIGRWQARHLRFGLNSAPGGILAELYTRIDVLVLGVFFAESLVGVYSLAAQMVEGLIQVAVVLRANLSPFIARLFKDGGGRAVRAFLKSARWRCYAAALGMAVGLIACFPFIVKFISDDDAYLGGWQPLVILALGFAATSLFHATSQLALQTASPKFHSYLVALGVAVNTALSFLLVPLFAMEGAAVATAISWVVSSLILDRFVRKLPDGPPGLPNGKEGGSD